MERGARKKRILHGSGDRFALITGRIHNLDTASPPPTPISFNNPQIVNDDDHHRPPPQPSRLVCEGGDNLSQKYELDNGNRDADTMQASSPTHKSGTESSVVDARIGSTKASDDAEIFLKPRGLRSRFTAKIINSSILSSEDTRVFCSIMIALLVVIAYANLPHHIVKSESLIASRPLYVLLLTDVMIVILRVTSTKHNESGGKDTKLKQTINSQEDETIDWDGAIKVLEWGLVLYQTVRAIFIDCSFYTVIVICGFCFM